MLNRLEILGGPVGSVGEALLVLEGVLCQFRADYDQLLDSVIGSGVRLYVCTIYLLNFPDAELQQITSTALGLFNDVIVEKAAHRRLPILDLRGIFTDSRDYANPIEPSVEGGRKLADAIVGLALNSDSVVSRGSVIV